MESFAGIVMHFVGIGGIGMSGIAQVLHSLGCRVQGSDIKESPTTLKLQSLGIQVFIGHDGAHLQGVGVVVISTDIQKNNKELVAARAQKIPVVHRADMLAEIMRLKSAVAVAGTHGKTTTTSLVACLLDGAGLDPTVVNGGIINAYGTNARRGLGAWVVAEADESDGSFMRLPATVAVVTNIDPEHMCYYGTEEILYKAFLDFVSRIPFHGVGILCIDHPVVRRLAQNIQDRRIVTYGFSEDADIRGENISLKEGGMEFDIRISAHGQPPYSPHRGAELLHKIEGEVSLKKVFLPMVGQHNVQNALAAIGVAWQMGMPAPTILQGLRNFSGVKRRFTQVGTVKGVTIIDDYGHHPVEIQAVLKAARSVCSGKIVAVFQPHRYSRVSDLFSDFTLTFKDADHVIVAPIYGAGEENLLGVTHHDLAAGIGATGHPSVTVMDNPQDLSHLVAPLIEPGDYVVCLGAGTVTEWAHGLPLSLQTLLSAKAC
jgi:UDP-N-acetylmuramate--alanine ligase